MSRFARGKRALGICDRCGGTFKLATLMEERVRGHAQGNRVCTSCWDPDHPQNWFGSKTPVDAEALRDPRPDTKPGR